MNINPNYIYFTLIAFLSCVAAILYLKYSAEKKIPKDNKRRPFSRDEVIKVAWQHYEKVGPHCASCPSSEDMDIDHIIPISRGGHNGLDNLQILCGRCNSKKGKKLDNA